MAAIEVPLNIGRGTRSPCAHSRPSGDDAFEFHDLVDHLRQVALRAEESAALFGAKSWGHLAGLWHDLGKYRPAFQSYILRASGADPDAHIEAKAGRVTHSAAGALWAERHLVERCGKQGSIAARVLAYLIAGHHAGLDNWDGGLKERLAGRDAQAESAEALGARPPLEILEPAVVLPNPRDIPVDGKTAPPGAFALWVRMLFSCLVDADFLDTEAFMDAGKSGGRLGYPNPEKLARQFEVHMDARLADLHQRGESLTTVNRLRSEVLRQCREKAVLAPGVFTLTVPTGGGKTLSSLAFALRHAVTHGKRRIVYAIPYTSIIEQTAGIFREIFGDENVVEHHSNVESSPTEETSRSRLACENWDAPLIVTTNVQLFESLFAGRTSRCRKLHNLVDSVIVLDEAQLLPVGFLQPILDVLNLLVKQFGVTVVLSTATQPALATRAYFDPRRNRRGLDDAKEIIDDVPALYATLKRVAVHIPMDFNDRREWPGIADEVSHREAALVVVNRRADARELFRLVRQRNQGGAWHLSGLMCPQHRHDTIAAIKTGLEARRTTLAAGLPADPVRVVSTQLVEAGVDLDFPVVYRAMAGLDSIAQAAGRCNREGRLERGEVHVFVPPTLPPPGLLRQAESECRAVWHDRPADPFELGLFSRYFERLYGDSNLDQKDICGLLRFESQLSINFREAAERFRLIDDAEAATVIVRYSRPGESTSPVEGLINLLAGEGPSRWLMRRLQGFGVSIYRRDLDRLRAQGDVEEVRGCPGLFVQVNDLLYDATTGLDVDGAPGDPARLVI